MNDILKYKKQYNNLSIFEKMELLEITADSLNVEYKALLYKGKQIPTFKQFQRLIIKRTKK